VRGSSGGISIPRHPSHCRWCNLCGGSLAVMYTLALYEDNEPDSETRSSRELGRLAMWIEPASQPACVQRTRSILGNSALRRKTYNPSSYNPCLASRLILPANSARWTRREQRRPLRAEALRERSHRARVTIIWLASVPVDYPPSLHARLGLIRWPIARIEDYAEIFRSPHATSISRGTAERKVSIASDRPSPSNPPRRKACPT